MSKKNYGLDYYTAVVDHAYTDHTSRKLITDYLI